jgi:hypothetical protein
MMLLVTPCYREVVLKPYHLIKRKIFRRNEVQIIDDMPNVGSTNVISSRVVI